MIDTDKESAEFILMSQVKWYVETFGVKYIPDWMGFTFDGKKPQTKQEWIDYLDEIIANTSD